MAQRGVALPRVVSCRAAWRGVAWCGVALCGVAWHLCGVCVCGGGGGGGADIVTATVTKPRSLRTIMLVDTHSTLIHGTSIISTQYTHAQARTHSTSLGGEDSAL